ncbi:hypothetical protein TNCV_5041711 [Trichonephila clavipes]|nr:hypothetical protein TNCV_5041711 [Trichonephila clavipes]
MVSPAVQGQVPHPSIVPEFLRSTICGMTSARGHGAIVYCLNSGREKEKKVGRREKRREKRTKRVRGRERTEGEGRKDGRDERRRQERRRKKRAESGIGVKKTMNAGGVENGI